MIYNVAEEKLVWRRVQRQSFIKGWHLCLQAPGEPFGGPAWKDHYSVSAHDNDALIHGPLTVYRQAYKVFSQ